jgi:RNA polymerase sigma-70 factor (ECF subfamily)
MSEYVDRLPEPLRMALLLRHGFGYSLEEIGELIEITPNAAKKRVSRGRQAVRRMIRKDGVVGLHIGGGKS